MIKVLVADDHAIVRRGLRQILAETHDLILGGEAASGPEVVDKARAERWDAVVLDLNLGGASGLALLRDNRIPAWQRATVVALLALVFTPIDVVNAIPVVGQFWDFTLAVVILDGFIQFAPAHVVNEHIVALGLQKKIPLREL